MLAPPLHHSSASSRWEHDSSRNMMPRLGRASYLGDRVKGHPDAGAVAALEWIKAISDVK